MFPLVRELADDGLDVAVTCRDLGVRRQGYYEWRSGHRSARGMENELLLKHIDKIHHDSRAKLTERAPAVQADANRSINTWGSRAPPGSLNSSSGIAETRSNPDQTAAQGVANVRRS